MKGERRYLNGELDVNGFVSLNFKLHFIIFIPNVKSQLHNGSFCFLIYPRICTLTRKVRRFISIPKFQVQSKNTMSLTEPHP